MECDFDWQSVPLMEVDGDDAAEVIKQGDFDTLIQAICVLKHIAQTEDLTEGQIEFLELAFEYSKQQEPN